MVCSELGPETKAKGVETSGTFDLFNELFAFLPKRPSAPVSQNFIDFTLGTDKSFLLRL